MKQVPKLGDQAGTPRLARPAPLPQTQLTVQQYSWNSFKLGHVSADSPADLPQGACARLQDLEVSAADRLVAAPGVSVIQSLFDTPVAVWSHKSLNRTAELFCIFSNGTTQVLRDDASVPAGAGGGLPTVHLNEWVFTQFGDVLIFTNGVDSVFARSPGATQIDVLPAPVGRTLGVHSTRLFVGGAVIGGNYIPMGVAWSASGDYRDFVNVGSGFEELIYDTSEGDYISAMSSMSLDLFVVLARHSLWIGRFTGDDSHPLDFEPRVTGKGVFAPGTVQRTDQGVIYLSDSGVELFDGNTSTCISAAINPELLPLDTDHPWYYQACYDPSRRRYYLFTATGTWVYDMLDEAAPRWYFRTLQASFGVMFAAQQSIVGTRWSDYGATPPLNAATWASMAGLTWEDIHPQEGVERLVMVLGVNVGYENPASTVNFGLQPMTPVYESSAIKLPDGDDLVLMRTIVTRHVGQGSVLIGTPDHTGAFVVRGQAIALPLAVRTRAIRVNTNSSGLDLAVQLQLFGTAQLSSITAEVVARSRRVTNA